MATISDISKQTGVSPATVSRVLNNDESFSVSEKVKQNILDTAYRLGYMTPREKKERNKQLTIGVDDFRIIVRPGQDNHIQALGRAAKLNRQNSRIDFVRLSEYPDRKYDGIIAFGGLNESEILDLKKISRNILLIDCTLEDFEINQIRVNLDRSFKETLQYLRDHNATEVGYIGGMHQLREDYTIGYARRESACLLMRECGTYADDKVLTGSFTVEDGYKLAAKLLKDHPEVNGIYIGSDAMAEGVFRAIHESGKTIGTDIFVVVYRDIHVSSLPDEKLAVIDGYPDLMWDKAIDMLTGAIAGQRESLNTVITPWMKIIG